MKKYDPELLDRPQIVCSNKEDLCVSDEVRERLAAFCKENGYDLYYLSAQNNVGVREVLQRAAELLPTLPPLKEYETEYVPEQKETEEFAGKRVTVRRENGVWYVEGDWLLQFIRRIDFADRESLRFFQKVMRDSGVEKAMQDAGVKDGDTVDLYGLEFDYVY